jgi:hypothetical protein
MLVSLRVLRQARLSYGFKRDKVDWFQPPWALAGNFRGGRNYSGFGPRYAKLSALLIQH